MEEHPTTKVALLDTKKVVLSLRSSSETELIRGAMPEITLVPTAARVQAESAESFAFVIRKVPSAVAGPKIRPTDADKDVDADDAASR